MSDFQIIQNEDPFSQFWSRTLIESEVRAKMSRTMPKNTDDPEMISFK